MTPIGVALSVGALVLLLSGRAATRRCLEAHVARYGKLPPNLYWFCRADNDPEIEALRRSSLAVRLKAIGLVILGTLILFASTP